MTETSILIERVIQHLVSQPLSYTTITVQSEHGTYANLAGRLLWVGGQHHMFHDPGEVVDALIELGFSSSLSEELVYFEGNVEEAIQWLKQYSNK